MSRVTSGSVALQLRQNDSRQTAPGTTDGAQARLTPDGSSLGESTNRVTAPAARTPLATYPTIANVRARFMAE